MAMNSLQRPCHMRYPRVALHHTLVRLAGKVLALAWGGVAAFITFPAVSRGECLGTIRGPIVVSVTQCQKIDPAIYFKTPQTIPSWFVQTYNAKDAAAILRSYAGLLVQAQVRESQAVDTAVDDRSALFGQSVGLFLPGAQLDCAQLPQAGLMAGEVNRVCCDQSAADAPCFLNTEYKLLAPAAAGSLAAVAGNAGASPAAPAAAAAAASGPVTPKVDVPAGSPVAHNPLLAQAHTLFTQKRVEEALLAFEKAEAQGRLDPLSSYLMGLAYYLGGKSNDKAIAALEKVRVYYHELDGKEVPKFMRRSLLLLARCYGIEKEAELAGVVLGELLIDPIGFREEIEIAMRHEDLGWIHSTKQYQKFMEKAAKALSAKP